MDNNIFNEIGTTLDLNGPILSLSEQPTGATGIGTAVVPIPVAPVGCSLNDNRGPLRSEVVPISLSILLSMFYEP